MTRRTSRKPVRKNSRRRTSRGYRTADTSELVRAAESYRMSFPRGGTKSNLEERRHYAAARRELSRRRTSLQRNNSTYYSVHIPFSKTPTEWHPTSSTGPFAVLSRGKFSTVQQAHDWAREHLGYKPVYKVVPHTLHENSRARYTRAWRGLDQGIDQGTQLRGTNPEGLTWDEWRAAARTGGLHTAKLIAAWRAGEDPIEHRDLRRNGGMTWLDKPVGPGTKGWSRFGGLYRSGDYAFDGSSPFSPGRVEVFLPSGHEALGRARDIDEANEIVNAHRNSVQRNGKPIGKIEDDTPIVPWIVADGVIIDAQHGLGRPLSEKMELSLANGLVKKAQVVYKNNESFRKKIRARGNKGRDTLYAFMHHWLAAAIKKRNPALYKQMEKRSRGT